MVEFKGINYKMIKITMIQFGQNNLFEKPRPEFRDGKTVSVPQYLISLINFLCKQHWKVSTLDLYLAQNFTQSISDANKEEKYAKYVTDVQSDSGRLFKNSQSVDRYNSVYSLAANLPDTQLQRSNWSDSKDKSLHGSSKLHNKIAERPQPADRSAMVDFFMSSNTVNQNTARQCF
jgi:hypothetical protein